MNNINEVLDFIYSQQRIDLGLERIEEALKRVGNPHLQYKTIHIAGTNGKGSTTNYIYTILKEQGYKVGAFTSPFLEAYNDRIRINDQFISDEEVLTIVNTHVEMIKELNLSFFEIFTFIAAIHFANNKVDFAIFEVGMGGRYDATNVVKPLVCGITNIGFDHMNTLGTTIAEIAYQKAGIIKENVPIFTTCEKDDAVRTIEKVAADKNAPCLVINDFGKFDYHLSMKGTYQKKNATLALAIIKYLSASHEISEESIKSGFMKAKWLGRFEEIQPNVFVDGAHNIEGITGLVHTIETDFNDKDVKILFSALRDKEVTDMLALLSPFDLQLTTFDFYRAMHETDLKALKKPYILDFKQAVDDLLNNKTDDQVIVITGSLYFITEVRNYLLN